MSFDLILICFSLIFCYEVVFDKGNTFEGFFSNLQLNMTKGLFSPRIEVFFWTGVFVDPLIVLF